MSGNAVGRKRFAKNRNLERYVKIKPNGYVTYKHPRMKKSESFGKDIEAANEVARLVNAKYSNQASRIDKILNPRSKSFNHVLDRFEKERIHELKWSIDYKKEQKRKIKKFREYGGDEVYQDTDVLFFSAMVDELFAGDSRRIAIFLLRTIDAFAVGKGLRRGAIVCEGILAPIKSDRQRQRIKTYQDFLVIRAQADEWLQDAMDFALITLQPREVLCSLNLNMIQGSKLRVRRGKTGVYIEIEIGPSLTPLIKKRREIAMKLGTRRLISRAPVRGNSVIIKPDYMTRAVTNAVIASELYEEDHPTLHEIRSLGARMYEERGYDKQLIQNLMGHKKSSTTGIYLDPDEPKYIKAAANLAID